MNKKFILIAVILFSLVLSGASCNSSNNKKDDDLKEKTITAEEGKNLISEFAVNLGWQDIVYSESKYSESQAFGWTARQSFSSNEWREVQFADLMGMSEEEWQIILTEVNADTKKEYFKKRCELFNYSQVISETQIMKTTSRIKNIESIDFCIAEITINGAFRGGGIHAFYDDRYEIIVTSSIKGPITLEEMAGIVAPIFLKKIKKLPTLDVQIEQKQGK